MTSPVRIDWGDGTPVTPVESGEVVEHEYTRAGSFTITAFDSSNSASTSDTCTFESDAVVVDDVTPKEIVVGWGAWATEPTTLTITGKNLTPYPAPPDSYVPAYQIELKPGMYVIAQNKVVSGDEHTNVLEITGCYFSQDGEAIYGVTFPITSRMWVQQLLGENHDQLVSTYAGPVTLVRPDGPVPPMRKITACNPAQGASVSVGDTITLTGQGFTHTGSITVNMRSSDDYSTGTSYTVTDDTTMTVTVPNGDGQPFTLVSIWIADADGASNKATFDPNYAVGAAPID